MLHDAVGYDDSQNACLPKLDLSNRTALGVVCTIAMGEGPKLDAGHEDRVFALCAAHLLQLAGKGGQKMLPADLPARAVIVVTERVAAALRQLITVGGEAGK